MALSGFGKKRLELIFSCVPSMCFIQGTCFAPLGTLHCPTQKRFAVAKFRRWRSVDIVIHKARPDLIPTLYCDQNLEPRCHVCEVGSMSRFAIDGLLDFPSKCLTMNTLRRLMWSSCGFIFWSRASATAHLNRGLFDHQWFQTREFFGFVPKVQFCPPRRLKKRPWRTFLF